MRKTIITCDRCRAEIKGKPYILHREDCEWNLFKYEICDKCQKELTDWFYPNPSKLSCKTCKWHWIQCGNPDPCEGKGGYVSDDDWCKLYAMEGKETEE